MRAAAVQLHSTDERDRNLEKANRLTLAAVKDGAELVVLPEKFNVLGTSEQMREGAEPLDGPTISWASNFAKDHQIWLVAGSIVEYEKATGSYYNTSVLLGPDGEVRAHYRKIHMFDVEVGGVTYRESDLETSGDSIVTAGINTKMRSPQQPWRSDAERSEGEESRSSLDPERDPSTSMSQEATKTSMSQEATKTSMSQEATKTSMAQDATEVKLGMAVCYDLRFPEVFRILALAGAEITILPSAFTMQTGKHHWHVLIRARAIENQFFIVAADQIGEWPAKHHHYGHSVIVDPWGAVLTEAADEETYVIADLDLNYLQEVRAKLPSLANRRPTAYRMPGRSNMYPSP